MTAVAVAARRQGEGGGGQGRAGRAEAVEAASAFRRRSPWQLGGGIACGASAGADGSACQRQCQHASGWQSGSWLFAGYLRRPYDAGWLGRGQKNRRPEPASTTQEAPIHWGRIGPVRRSPAPSPPAHALGRVHVVHVRSPYRCWVWVCACACTLHSALLLGPPRGRAAGRRHTHTQACCTSMSHVACRMSQSHSHSQSERAQCPPAGGRGCW